MCAGSLTCHPPWARSAGVGYLQRAFCEAGGGAGEVGLECFAGVGVAVFGGVEAGEPGPAAGGYFGGDVFGGPAAAECVEEDGRAGFRRAGVAACVVGAGGGDGGVRGREGPLTGVSDGLRLGGGLEDVRFQAGGWGGGQLVKERRPRGGAGRSLQCRAGTGQGGDQGLVTADAVRGTWGADTPFGEVGQRAGVEGGQCFASAEPAGKSG